MMALQKSTAHLRQTARWKLLEAQRDHSMIGLVLTWKLDWLKETEKVPERQLAGSWVFEMLRASSTRTTKDQR